MSPRPVGDRSVSAPPADPRRGDLDRAQVPGPLRVEPPLGRGTVERSPLPGRAPATRPGQVTVPDRYGERGHQVAYNAAIALAASIVVGQLWALTVALDAWLDGHDTIVGWILAFQVVSFAVALAVWLATTRRSP